MKYQSGKVGDLSDWYLDPELNHEVQDILKDGLKMLKYEVRSATEKALPFVMSDALTATFKKGTSSPTADFIGPDLQVSLFLSTNESSENRLVWKESIMEIAAWCGPAHRKETIEALEAAAKYLRDAEDYESTHS